MIIIQYATKNHKPLYHIPSSTLNTQLFINYCLLCECTSICSFIAWQKYIINLFSFLICDDTVIQIHVMIKMFPPSGLLSYSLATGKWKKKQEQGWGIHKSSQQLSRWIYTEIHMQGISLAQYTTCKEIAWVYVMYVHISSYIQFEKTNLDSIFIGDLAQCKVVPLSYFPALAELILPDARR